MLAGGLAGLPPLAPAPSQGLQQGLIDGDAAEDLLKEVEDIAESAGEGDFGKAEEKLRELRQKIGERQRDGRIDPGFAGQLRGAVAEMDAALARN